MDRPPLYAQFAGDEIDGKVYGLGDTIESSVDDATVAVLKSTGRISEHKPDSTIIIVGDDGTDVDKMNRAELEQAAFAAFRERLPSASDDDLRQLVQRTRDERAERRQPDGAPAQPTYAEVKDKPTSRMTTAELIFVAQEESVSLDDATNNADRAALIDKARAERSGS